MLLMEKMFDCWCDLDSTTPDAFLTQYFTHEHEAGKIKIDDRYAIDIFEDCLRTYSEIVGVRNRKFPLNRIVLLYAIVIYLINRDTITENQFIRRLRIVNNLVQNSEDEISDSENRSSGNRMPAILRQVDSIMVAGVYEKEKRRIHLMFKNYLMSFMFVLSVPPSARMVQILFPGFAPTT